MSVRNYVLVAKRITLLLFLYTLCRLLFLIFNLKTFEEATSSSLFLAFIYGIRFDLSIIFSSNLPFIVFSIVPFTFLNSRTYQKILKTVFIFVNSVLLFMNLADVEYFKFTSKRTGYDIIGIMGDVGTQSMQLALYYWHIPILFGVLVFMLFRFYDSAESVGIKRISKFYSWILVPLILLFSILVIRGGLQYKPLKPDHAFVLTPNVLGNLVLNTPYNFFTTLSFPKLENVSYYESDNDVRNIIKQSKPESNFQNNKVNVVVIILESFSREYMGIGAKRNGYTPFLDSLARVSTFFDHNFANGRRSVEAVPSIFASIPSLMDEPYITGVYQGNELHGLAEVLAKAGYNTSFFHGGRNGTMGFDKFSINAGFQKYYGLDEYPNKDKDFDGNWGIYDEPYLNYFCNTVSSFKKPFMTSVFTLSSHQPYSVPDKYKGVFPKGKLDIHESIGYADYSLKKFFDKAKTTDWYNNTLFVITADHTQSLVSPKYNTPIGEYKIPLILFHPNKQIKGDTSNVTQQLDIMPTILDYVGVENVNPILFGRSVLDNVEGRALFYTNNSYVYVKKDFYIVFDKETFSFFRSNDWKRKNEIHDKTEIKAQYERELKAYIQYYNNGLNSNNWYR